MTRRASAARQRAYYRLRAGMDEAARGQWALAQAKFAEALDLDHVFAEARLWLGYVLERQGRPGAALRQYQVGSVFAPASEELRLAAQRVTWAAAEEQSPEGRQAAAARGRLIPNLVVAALLPPTAVTMGLWEIATARSPEWRDLGVKTLAAGCIAGVFWASVILVVLGPSAHG